MLQSQKKSPRATIFDLAQSQKAFKTIVGLHKITLSANFVGKDVWITSATDFGARVGPLMTPKCHIGTGESHFGRPYLAPVYPKPRFDEIFRAASQATREKVATSTTLSPVAEAKILQIHRRGAQIHCFFSLCY